jgi:ABC-type antimicrobial peptide transport system permease subunit
VLPISFYIRTADDPAALAPAIRALVHRIDPDLPIDNLETMQEHLDELLFGNRFVTSLSAAMGMLALVLAAIGLYGVLAFSVAQRTREIGIRMAMGANRSSIATLIARQVARLVLAGVAVGAFLGWLGVRILVSHDAGLANAPLWLFSITGMVLLAVMALAALLPARHAASIDPIQTLRSE